MCGICAIQCFRGYGCECGVGVCKMHVEEGESVHAAVDNATDGDKAIVYSWTHDEKTTATGPLIAIEKNTQESIGIDNDTICVSLKLA